MSSRAYTRKEVQERFLDSLRNYMNYWENCQLPKEDDNLHYRMDGLVFSILNVLDGTSANFPACEVTVQPHPDDKQYHIDNHENWYKPGMSIHGGQYLHDLWYGDK